MAPQNPQLRRVERIDGIPYVYGSREHAQAIDHAIDRVRRVIIAHGIVAEARLDANQTAFLARDLVYVSRDVQTVLYDKLRAAEFIPIRSTVPKGAKTWVYRQRDIAGEAREGASLSADDAPNIDVKLEEFPNPVTYVDASYQYTLDELMAAAFAGIPLVRDKANAAAEAIARKLDKLMRVGSAIQGITGFFNNPNVPTITLTNGEWLTATADEISEDWAQIEQAGIANSRDNHSFKRIILPTAYEGVLASNIRGQSDMTLRRWLTENGRSIKQVDRWGALDDATGDDVGVADPPQGIVYDPSPDNVYAEIPLPYDEIPPQPRNFAWVVNCYAIFGGVVFTRPKSAAYIENLD